MPSRRTLSIMALLLLLAASLAACGGGGVAQTGTGATDPEFPRLMDGRLWADPTGRISADLMKQLQAESQAVAADRFQLAGVFFTNCASDPTTLAINFANYNGIGSSKTNNGITVVVLLDRPGSDGNTPSLAVAVGDGLKDILTKDVLDRIFAKDFIPARSDDNWEKGLLATVRSLHRVVMDPEAEELKTPKKSPWVAIIVITFVIIVGIMGGFSGANGTRTRTRTTTHHRSGGGGHSSGGSST